MANQNYFITDFPELEDSSTVIGRFPAREGGFSAESIINKPAGCCLVVVQDEEVKGFNNSADEVDFYLAKDCKTPLKSGLFSSKYKNTEVYLLRSHNKQVVDMGTDHLCKAKVLNGKMLRVQFRNLKVSVAYDVIPETFQTSYHYIKEHQTHEEEDSICISADDVETVVRNTILDFFREQLVDKYRPALQKDEKGIFISSSDYAWTFVRMGSLEKALCGPVFAELKAMGLEPKELKFCK